MNVFRDRLCAPKPSQFCRDTDQIVAMLGGESLLPHPARLDWGWHVHDRFHKAQFERHEYDASRAPDRTVRRVNFLRTSKSGQRGFSFNVDGHTTGMNWNEWRGTQNTLWDSNGWLKLLVSELWLFFCLVLPARQWWIQVRRLQSQLVFCMACCCEIQRRAFSWEVHASRFLT